MAQRKSRYWLGSRGPFLFNPEKEGEVPFLVQQATAPNKFDNIKSVALGSSETQVSAAEESLSQQTEHSNGAVSNARQAHKHAFNSVNYPSRNAANVRIP